MNAIPSPAHSGPGDHESRNPEKKASKRWRVEIHYRTTTGAHLVHREVEEIEELQSIIEKGPSFYAIMSILIMPTGRCEPCTLEEAAEA